MSDLQKIIQRIQQLRAISQSTHSRAEAETCLQLVSKLIAEHQLSEAIIETESGKKNDEIFTDRNSDWNVVYETGRASEWKSKLVFGLARLNGLYALQFHGIRNDVSHRRGSRFRVFGRKSDIEICKYMFDYLVHMIAELSETYVPGGKKRGVNPERESWCSGCVSGFLAKMNAEKTEVMKKATSTAMVLISNRECEAKTALFDAYPTMKTHAASASKAQLNSINFESGYRKGQTLTINRGMGGGGNNSPPLLG